MAAYRRVYDSRRLQADCRKPGLGADRPLDGVKAGHEPSAHGVLQGVNLSLIEQTDPIFFAPVRPGEAEGKGGAELGVPPSLAQWGVVHKSISQRVAERAITVSAAVSVEYGATARRQKLAIRSGKIREKINLQPTKTSLE